MHRIRYLECLVPLFAMLRATSVLAILQVDVKSPNGGEILTRDPLIIERNDPRHPYLSARQPQQQFTNSKQAGAPPSCNGQLQTVRTAIDMPIDTENSTTGTSSVLGINSQQSDPADTANCLRPFISSLSSKCWNELNLTAFVLDWTKTHICSAEQGAVLGRCFLEQVGYVDKDCSKLSVGTCVALGRLPDKLSDPIEQVKAFYVAHNIRCKHRSFRHLVSINSVTMLILLW